MVQILVGVDPGINKTGLGVLAFDSSWQATAQMISKVELLHTEVITTEKGVKSEKIQASRARIGEIAGRIEQLVPPIIEVVKNFQVGIIVMEDYQFYRGRERGAGEMQLMLGYLVGQLGLLWEKGQIYLVANPTWKSAIGATRLSKHGIQLLVQGHFPKQYVIKDDPGGHKADAIALGLGYLVLCYR